MDEPRVVAANTADGAAGQRGPHGRDPWMKPHVAPDVDVPAVPGGRLGQAIHAIEARRERLLDEDVRARLDRCARDSEMPMRGRADDDAVGSGLQPCRKIGNGPHVELARDVREPPPVRIGHADGAGVQRAQVCRVAAPDRAHADDEELHRERAFIRSAASRSASAITRWAGSSMSIARSRGIG